MSIDFDRLKALRTPKGVVTQITDAAGNVLWSAEKPKPVVLGVKKITSDTYAGETTYENEQFILLDIYPKTNGTVSVTYGGLTKTITDTSGAAEPNAQQVYFGTFNGVSDSVVTPASGELTIEGDYYAFGVGTYTTNSKGLTEGCLCITEVKSYGKISKIPPSALSVGSVGCAITNGEIPDGVITIGYHSFMNTQIATVYIPSSVLTIEDGAFAACYSLRTVQMMGTTPPTLEPSSSGTYVNFGLPSASYFALEEIIVPKGYGNTYKNATGWSTYADYIVEAS